MGNFEKRVETFKSLVEVEILDPPGVHHELSGGLHGQKLDFDKITDESDLYEMWVDVTTDFIGREFEWRPEVILGVANGTNRLALDVARRFKGKTIGLTTEKDPHDKSIIRLSELAGRVIKSLEPELVLVLEDVATTGGNALQPAKEVQGMLQLQDGLGVQVLNTWQRQPALPKLEESGVVYQSIIMESLPTYTADVCQAHGFCAQEDWTLIPR